eukprot:scaffold235407_cov55-Attheya_sp.AAC.1
MGQKGTSFGRGLAEKKGSSWLLVVSTKSSVLLGAKVRLILSRARTLLGSLLPRSVSGVTTGLSPGLRCSDNASGVLFPRKESP